MHNYAATVLLDRIVLNLQARWAESSIGKNEQICAEDMASETLHEQAKKANATFSDIRLGMIWGKLHAFATFSLHDSYCAAT